MHVKQLIVSLLKIITITISLLLAGSAQPLYAQSQIRGFILDGNQRPIGNGHVVLINTLDSVEVLRIITNEDGSYMFTYVAIGDYIIKATAIGFLENSSSKYSIVSGEDDVDAGILALQANSHQLNEVIVRKEPLFQSK